MDRVFNESPSRRTDYERISSDSKEDYPLFFATLVGWRTQMLSKSSVSLAKACSSGRVLVNTSEKVASPRSSQAKHKLPGLAEEH